MSNRRPERVLQQLSLIVKDNSRKYVEPSVRDSWMELDSIVIGDDEDSIREAIKKLNHEVSYGPSVDLPTLDLEWLDPLDPNSKYAYYGYSDGVVPPPYSREEAKDAIREAHARFFTVFSGKGWLEAGHGKLPDKLPPNAIEAVKEATSSYVEFRKLYSFFLGLLGDSHSRLRHANLSHTREEATAYNLELEEEWRKVYDKAFPSGVFVTPINEEAALELGRLAVGYATMKEWSKPFFSHRWSAPGEELYSLLMDWSVKVFGDPFTVEWEKNLRMGQYPGVIYPKALSCLHSLEQFLTEVSQLTFKEWSFKAGKGWEPQVVTFEVDEI